ncbi:hypothetical protein A6V39_00340 [Candidatus Mycoplasma haematobovis]|uniref:Uncharacterized protein n=1 Tax=Candidatus Mycoplasma haematobovis TaxID=432608 RepID=A0A1A9QE25_9MOLU|nr:hypothetical protein [Candidatus Mycoplasma haematobovis]OAL10498.1 hypothetical protein A6V39_00340 [Candidatus Mycoplasma haematobovis]
MNIHPVAKGLIGLGISGGIAGGGYALFPSSTKNEITKELISKHYTILTNDPSNKTHWDSIIASYKALTTPPQNSLKFAELTGNEDDAVSKLQGICNKLLNPSSSTTLDTDKKAEKWCVEPISVSAILEKRGIKQIANSAQTNWESKIILHRSEQDTNKKISNLSIGTTGTINPEHLTDIKNKCRDIGNKKNHEDKYDENLTKFTSWCANT